MANIQVALITAGDNPSRLPVEGKLIAAQVLTLSGSSQTSTVVVPEAYAEAAKSGLVFWRVTCYELASAFAAVSTGTPTASGTAGRVCPYGLPTVWVANPGEKIAVIQVS